uniref:Death-associated protein 1 n=1 Tax=Catagonus wagneri TaxID=51154 RepID=A0A8C3YS84_9CETA
MSSPPEGKLETKAGHPPAVKAGGMRIVQKHPHSGDTKEEKDKDDQEWESPSSPLMVLSSAASPPIPFTSENYKGSGSGSGTPRFLTSATAVGGKGPRGRVLGAAL